MFHDRPSLFVAFTFCVIHGYKNDVRLKIVLIFIANIETDHLLNYEIFYQ